MGFIQKTEGKDKSAQYILQALEKRPWGGKFFIFLLRDCIKIKRQHRSSFGPLELHVSGNNQGGKRDYIDLKGAVTQEKRKAKKQTQRCCTKQ